MRRDPITEELHLNNKQLEQLRQITFGTKVETDEEAARAFPRIVKYAGKIGANVLQAVLANWIEQLFPHLLPLWRSFERFLDNPRRGFRWPY